MLYKIRCQNELKFKKLKSCDKLRGATTVVLNIVLSMLLLALIVNLIQVLYTFVCRLNQKPSYHCTEFVTMKEKASILFNSK